MTPELQQKRDRIREFGLIVTESQTNPSRPGKQSRPVWNITGVNLRKYEHVLRDELDLKMWRGVFSAWSDPTDNLLDALEEAKPLAVEEIQEYAADRSLARAERLDDRTSKALNERDSRHQASNQIAERFAGGQPILVGHHSEGRARRDQARIHNHMSKSVEADKKANALSSRADGARQNAEKKTEYTLKYAGNRLKEAEAERNKAIRNVSILERSYVVYIGDNEEWRDQKAYVSLLSKDGKAVIFALKEREREDGQFDFPMLENVPIDHLRLDITEADLRTQEIRRQNAEEAIAYWSAQVQQLGGEKFNKDTIKKGDYVFHWSSWRKVVRVNAKSVSVQSDYSWTNIAPYHEIKGHLTAEQYAQKTAAQPEASS